MNVADGSTGVRDFAATSRGPGPLTEINRILEPLVRMGLGAPLAMGPLPAAGLVVLEVPGRKTGRIYRVPLVASATRDAVLITTVRPRSQWFANLQAVAESGTQLRVWVRGVARVGTAWTAELASDDVPGQLPIWAGPASALLTARGFSVGWIALSS